MLLDIIKTLPAIFAGVISLALLALRVVEFILVFKIYKNTLKPGGQ